MAGRKERDPDYSSFADIFKKILNEILNSIDLELHTWPGKINLFFDILLAIIVVIIILSTSASSIARIVSSIFNPALTESTSDSTIFLLLAILIGFWILCLIFMLIVEDTWKKKNGK